VIEGVLVEPGPNRFGFVGGEVVTDDVDLAAVRLRSHDSVEERKKGLARVTLGGHTLDMARVDLECGVQRESTVTDILEAVAFGSSGRERQNRQRTLHRLDRGHLIDAEDCGMGGRVELEADDLSRLAFEIRIRARRVAFQPVRLEAGPFPDASDRRVT
jgi:hypothetical protein